MLQFTLSITYTETDYDGTTRQVVESIGCIDRDDVDNEMRIFAEYMSGVIIESVELIENYQ